MKISTVTLSTSLAAILAGSFCIPTLSWADSLKERQAKVSAVVAKTRPAVVGIMAGMGSGSGVIVSADGLVLTAAHVVDAAAAVPRGNRGNDENRARSGEVSVVLPDGREVKGKILGRDRSRDAAMVQIMEGKDWPHVDLAETNSITQGEWCIAMGHPGGFDPQRGAPVRFGRLWLNNDKAFYRSDCTVSGGDSGGPLFDLDGKVIGIHSSISMNLSENRHVPVKVFRDDWDRLKKGETWGNSNRVLSDANDLGPKDEDKARPERRQSPRIPDEPVVPDEPAAPAKGSVWLGIQMQNVDNGVAVVEIIEGSPAQKAGVELEDVILKVDGKAVGNTGDVASRVRSSAPGDKLKLTVKRGDSEKELDVTLAARK
ncbi:MAG TPA: trypsin-like peptidase domain-containing protein [Verrucomicrobiales bacterium]|nr:trypsin-like peptidase domain-containing protein [Verrucomicrobiales bacterium]